MTVREIAPRVWAAIRPEVFPVDPFPDDAAAATGMLDWRAREFLAGRALLRELLAKIRPEAADATMMVGASGKPGLAGWPDIGVNVSHDGGSVAACVALGRQVGIDVQHPPEEVGKAMIRLCARAYADRLAELPVPERAREFAWIWTAQEACVKAAGTGLAGGPWSIDVPPQSHAGTWRGFHWRSLRKLSAVPLSCAWEDTR